MNIKKRFSEKINYKNFCLIVLALLLAAMTFTFGYAETAADKSRQAAEAGKKADAMYKKVAEAGKRASELEAAIATNKRKIEEEKVKLDKLQKKVEKQTKSLNDRLSVMYKTGSLGFIDVVLSSENVSELLSNMNMVHEILRNDQELLKSLEDEYKEIKKLKKKQEMREKALIKDKKEIEALKAKYREQAKAYKQKEDQLEAEAAKLAAEAAAAQRAAEQRMRKQNSAARDKDKHVTNSAYVWPLNGAITSPYGMRTHPLFGTSRFHDGYDIGARQGTPIKAVGNGYVTFASVYGGYGNCIMIYIGNGYTTLYGHLSGFAVSNGAHVKKGQTVAYVGSTGWSTGPHLHFSVLKNGAYIDPRSIF